MKMAFPSKMTLLAANISKLQHTNIWQFQSIACVYLHHLTCDHEASHEDQNQEF